MTPARLEALTLAYGEGLAAAIHKHPHRYAMKADDTPESYAVRVAMTVNDLIQTRPELVHYATEGFRNACKALRIEHNERAINNYLGATL